MIRRLASASVPVLAALAALVAVPARAAEVQ
ncbi:MAG: hypothetical protein RJA59_1017, partial [Pseudomonadota bacterium]